MGFAGVYCCLSQNPRNLGELDTSPKKVFGGTKDFASEIVEVSCVSGFKRTTYGGVVGDEATVRVGCTLDHQVILCTHDTHGAYGSGMDVN